MADLQLPPRVTRNQVELYKARSAYHLRMAMVTGVTVTLAILSFSLPLYLVSNVVECLAGKETTVSVSVAWIVAAMVGGGGGVAVIITSFLKMRSQKNELVRQRNRINELEAAVTRQKA